MSTRCLIGMIDEGQSIIHSYCHHDGHPNYGGMRELLAEYYEQQDIHDLIMRGDMRALKSDVNDIEFYEGVESEYQWSRHLYEYVQRAIRCGAEYAYLWIPRGGWFVLELDKSFLKLTGTQIDEWHVQRLCNFRSKKGSDL